MVVSTTSRREWIPVAVGLAYVTAVALALRVALASSETDDFDGRNNLAQLFLGIPWALIPIGGLLSHEADAWLLAAFGWINAGLCTSIFGGASLAARNCRSVGARGFRRIGQSGRVDPETHSHDPERSRRLLDMVVNDDVDALVKTVTLREIAEAWTCYEQREADDTDDPDWWAVSIWTDSVMPKDLVREGLLALIDAVDEPLLELVGAGPLENFVTGDEDDLRWIERTAANSSRFRTALRGVWAWSSVNEATMQRLDAAAGQPLSRPTPLGQWPPDSSSSDGVRP